MKKHLLTSFAVLALAACGQTASDAPQTPQTPERSTTETSAESALPPAVSTGDWTLTPVATGFDFPWGIAFLPEGGMLVSEREGRLHFVAEGAETGVAVANVPEAVIHRQGGLLGIILDPDFESNRTLYIAYVKGTQDAHSTAVLSATLAEGATALENVTEIFVANPTFETGRHVGGRFAFMPDGTLLLGLGDGGNYMDEAQDSTNHFGALVRINTDGSIPADNPFADGEGGHPSIYSYGHRNVQGVAVDQDIGVIYTNEHGPKGGDEINMPQPSKNYGWPAITYGINYNGTIITEQTEAPGLEQPVLQWTPSIAPSGLALYTGDIYESWQGDLFTSALAGQKVQRVRIENGEVVEEEALFEDAGLRWRHVAQGPDGHLYLLSDEVGGSVYRVDPAG